jgi:nucleotide-binding universal stress UspA family protein
MKILVPVDGSEYTKRMLAHLGSHEQQWLNPSHQYTVLHAVPTVPARAVSALGHDEVQSYYAEEAEKVLAPIRRFFAERKLDATFVHQAGHAPEVIAKTADSGGYDLVIMGSHGHGTFGSLVMGSTASKVLAMCGVPVLLIR